VLETLQEQIHHIATHTETLEKMVVYSQLESSETHPAGEIWVRPLSMWEEKVGDVPRFTKVAGNE